MDKIKEDLISFIWKNQLYPTDQLSSVRGEALQIVFPGLINQDAGPDFLASKVFIAGTLWAGNVEIHVRSSDWYKHGHHKDEAYDNIILHVVFEHDKDVTNQRGRLLPTLELKRYVRQELVRRYMQLKTARSWIPCQHKIKSTDKFLLRNWLSRLLIERLQRKMTDTAHFFHYFSNDWERTFLFLLARNFGFRVNAIPFGLLLQKTPYRILLKNRDKLPILEAILFGQAGMLNQIFLDDYPNSLKEEYLFQKKMHALTGIDLKLWKFSRLRPANFPTLRIAQFASLICHHDQLFNTFIHADSYLSLKEILFVKASAYWNDHYRFDQTSSYSEKSLGESAIGNIIINTVAPIMFLYGKEHLKPALTDAAIELFQAIEPEKNHITRNWQTYGIQPQNAAESQALIELKKNYCTPRRCLDCQVGYQVLKA